MNFEGYIKKCNSIQPEHPLSINELRDPFFSLDINKSPGFDGISSTVLKNCFGALHKPLLHVFKMYSCIQVKEIFPDDLKIAPNLSHSPKLLHNCHISIPPENVRKPLVF